MQALCATAAALGMKVCQNDKIYKPHNKNLEADFNAHIAAYGISFGTTEEYELRLQQYAIKDAKINEINASQSSFTVGHNQFSHWTDDEYKQLLGYRGPKELPLDAEHAVLETVDLPTSIDWRTKGAVNHVQNQARCGSCWAFSATAAIEGEHFIKTGELLKLSEQQFVDCDTASYGCNGGW